jgi:hypothetical protein
LLIDHELKHGKKDDLTGEQIIKWAENYKKEHTHKTLPSASSGKIDRTREVWANVQVALQKGYRGLEG